MAAKSNIKGDPSKPFFEQNPDLRYYDCFVWLIDSYCDGDEQKAGKIAWAAWLMEDPDSTYQGFLPNERRIVIAKNYLKDEKFNWEDIKRFLTQLPNVAMTKAKKRYKQVSDTYDSVLQELVTDEEITTRQKADILAKVGVIEKGLSIAEEKFEKEKKEEEQVQSSKGPGTFG